MTIYTIRLITYPAADEAFRRRAEELARDVETPEQLQARLREEWRDARVVRGVTDRGEERWYAYRDGRWRTNG